MFAPAGAAEKVSLRGVVLDSTCPGPCAQPPPPLPPYAGPNLVVSIRDLGTGEVLRRLRPADGRFSFRVPKGAYRVRAFVGGQPQPNCYVGSQRRVEVGDAKVRVRLTIHNACVV